MVPKHVIQIRFERNYQNKLFVILMRKLDLSQRQLARKLEVSRSTLRNWVDERWLLPNYIFDRCVEILPELNSFSKFMLEKLPRNWGQIKGGKIRGKMKSNLTNAERIKGFRIANKTTFSRKIMGPLGERMYNEGERNIAEFLLKAGIKYNYEPLLKFGQSYCFPDFTTSNAIIERCGYSNWSVYWYRILKKVVLYNKNFKGKVILITPNDRFNIAIKRIGLKVKNVIILKENQLDALPLFLGP